MSEPYTFERHVENRLADIDAKLDRLLAALDQVESMAPVLSAFLGPQLGALGIQLPTLNVKADG